MPERRASGPIRAQAPAAARPLAEDPGPSQVRADDAPSHLRIDGDQLRGVLPDLIDALTDAVVVVDQERRIVAANRRYLEAFGASRPDLIGTSCEGNLGCPECLAGETTNSCTACKVITSKKPEHRIRSIPDPAGVPRRWEATFNPVLDERGDVSHVVEVWRDISERSKLEAQLSHSERLASLGSLAAGVAHEVNNPLASVLASAESFRRWLLRTPEIPEAASKQARHLIEACEREIARARETTDKLMLLAQPYSVRPSWVNLNQAVTDTLSLLGHQMGQQSIELTQDLGADVPPIWAKEGGIRGICMNLIMNAVQAMPDGGVLQVSTRTDRGRVTLEIRDSGPGIDPAILERIWDPFFTTKPVGKGTGLGLSITRTLVERYGGAIDVETKQGSGACFTVDLPVKGPGGADG